MRYIIGAPRRTRRWPVFSPVRDPAAVARVVTMPDILTAHPSIPLCTCESFIDPAGTKPVNISDPDRPLGTSPQLTLELLKPAAKIKVERIPCSIGVPAITTAIGNPVLRMIPAHGYQNNVRQKTWFEEEET